MLRKSCASPSSLQCITLAIGVLAFAATPAMAQPKETWRERGMPLIKKYCSDCHGVDLQEAEVDFSSYTNVSKIQHDETFWVEVLKRIEFGAMPPEDADQPSKEERKQLIQEIESALYGASCDLDPRPGKVTLRRLNRAEYNNTIRDLFGIKLRPADEFPSDEVGAGFDNNGDVLTLPPMLMEKYLAAAEAVAARAVVDPDSLKKIDVKWEGDGAKFEGERKANSFQVYDLKPKSKFVANFELPYEGYYGLHVLAASRVEDERVRLDAFINGKRIGKLYFKYRNGSGGSIDHEWVGFKLPAGKYDLEIRLGEGEEEKHKVFGFRGARVDGPNGVPNSEVQSCHWELVKKTPNKERSVTDAAFENLKGFLPRVFRSPVDDDTVKRYASLAGIAAKREENFERSMQVALTAALVSPQFLFRDELPPKPGKVGEEFALNSHQLATRLSYFLWSSMPDDRLLDAAEDGRLESEDELRKQANRMFYDEKAIALADNFAAQWLGLRNLATIQPDPKQYAGFSEALRADMLEETRSVFVDCVKNGRGVLSLLDQDFTFANERLAKHYGIKDVKGDAFRRVSLKGTGRAGILTHASVLMLTSNPARTSPVKRGKWVMESILGTPPPDPPPGIPELEETSSANPNASLREQLAIHRDNAMCASCHRQMDAIGFGFENFDVIGRYREKDGKHEIDASATLPSGDKFNGAAELASLLRKQRGRMFVTELTKRLLTFALGRELNRQDRCVVEQIVDNTEKDGWKFLDLATQVVISKPFRYQTFQ